MQQRRGPALALTTLVRFSCRPLLPGLGALGGGPHMLSCREHGFQVRVSPLPLSRALKEDILADRDLLRRPVRESRRFLTPLQGAQPPQQLLRGHTRQGFWCQGWNQATFHVVVERPKLSDPAREGVRLQP